MAEKIRMKVFQVAYYDGIHPHTYEKGSEHVVGTQFMPRHFADTWCADGRAEVVPDVSPDVVVAEEGVTEGTTEEVHEEKRKPRRPGPLETK